MSAQTSPLDKTFIDAQRKRLDELLGELQASREFNREDELRLQEARSGQTHDSGGDAQKNALQDNDRAVRAHDRARVVNVRRALEKIEDGSYGKSDESGAEIPRARLEAAPESLYTVEEEEVREREAARDA